MRLKALHLRNIASIIEADIDFEKDLSNRVTGDPASIFLISGDTGAGKSVILDGIAMALFMTTPRINSVEGKQHNLFNNGMRESISTNDIRQYTRIGISPKDESYSEVEFTGNDNIEYKARLSLGISRNHTFKNMVWAVKRGDDDWITKKTSTKEIITEAIGLSFEQFCRIAMLAQGQFAEFLTGKKSERQEILEQLTGTEHFSAYGKAINDIYKRADAEKKAKQAGYDAELSHVLSEETLQELDDDLEVFTKQLSYANLEVEHSSKALSTRMNINRWTSELNEVRIQMKEVEQVMNSDSYSKAVKLISDWEETAEARANLVNLKSTQKAITEEEINLSRSSEELQKLVGGEPSLQDLDLKAITENIKLLTDRKNTLHSLSEGLLSADRESKWLIATEEEIQRETELLERLRNNKELAEEAFKKAESEYHDVNIKFSTLAAGLDDTLVRLRAQMHVNGAEMCPLCGQKINEHISTTAFEETLKPFKEMESMSRENLEAKRKESKKAGKNYDTLKGSLDEKINGRLGYKRRKEVFDQTAAMLYTKASELGINRGEEAQEQIQAALKEVEFQTKKMESLQKTVSNIEKSRAALIHLREGEERYLAVVKESGRNIKILEEIENRKEAYHPAKRLVNETGSKIKTLAGSASTLERQIEKSLVDFAPGEDHMDLSHLEEWKVESDDRRTYILTQMAEIRSRLEENDKNQRKLKICAKELNEATERYNKWAILNSHFGDYRFRALVQTYILRPLLNNANVYLRKITDRYTLTCDEQNDHLAILVHDNYNKGQVRSATVLSGGERFMVSLALSLALSSLNKQGMNVNILFIDEGFGTLDEHSLDSVMTTLERLQDIAGQTHRRVGIISHREELAERIPVQISVVKQGEGRSRIIV